MTLVDYAKKELNNLHDKVENKEMLEHIEPLLLDTLTKLSNIENTSYIMAYINIFNNLIKYSPLTPLTGDEDEWGEIKQSGFIKYQQNKRCARVFRNNANNDEVYIVDGTLFSDNGGETWFQCKESKFRIKEFPFDMTTFIQRHILLNKSHEDVDIKEQLEKGMYEIIW